MFGKNKNKEKILGDAGHTIYSIVSTVDNKVMYIGTNHKSIQIFDLKKNKIVGTLPSFKFY